MNSRKAPESARSSQTNTPRSWRAPYLQESGRKKPRSSGRDFPRPSAGSPHETLRRDPAWRRSGVAALAAHKKRPGVVLADGCRRLPRGAGADLRRPAPGAPAPFGKSPDGWDDASRACRSAGPSGVSHAAPASKQPVLASHACDSDNASRGAIRKCRCVKVSTMIHQARNDTREDETNVRRSREVANRAG